MIAFLLNPKDLPPIVASKTGKSKITAKLPLGVENSSWALFSDNVQRQA